MNSVLKMMEFLLKTINFALKSDGLNANGQESLLMTEDDRGCDSRLIFDRFSIDFQMISD